MRNKPRSSRWEEVVCDQVEQGADILDINMDDGLIEGVGAMTRFVNLLVADPETSRVPFMIDSSKVSSTLHWQWLPWIWLKTLKTYRIVYSQHDVLHVDRVISREKHVDASSRSDGLPKTMSELWVFLTYEKCVKQKWQVLLYTCWVSKEKQRLV